MSVATGQITISDLTDGRTFILNIRDNKSSGGYFSYEENKYDPVWDSNDPLVLTAYLVTTNDPTELMTNPSVVSNIVWQKNGVDITSADGTGFNTRALTITDPVKAFGNSNVISYKIKFTLKDPNFADAGIEGVPYEGIFNVTRVKQGAGANYVILMGDPDDEFYNSSDSASIKITPLVFKEGYRLSESQILNGEVASYAWYLYNDTLPVEDRWEQLTPDGKFPLNAAGLTITSGDIFGSEAFKYTCSLKGQETSTLEATINIRDYNDPVTVNVIALGSEVFKPDTAETKVLEAQIRKRLEDGSFQLLTSAEAEALYDFRWTNYTHNSQTPVWEKGFGATDPTNFNKNTITISRGDVTISNSFIVSVFEKPASVRRSFAATYGVRSLIKK